MKLPDRSYLFLQRPLRFRTLLSQQNIRMGTAFIKRIAALVMLLTLSLTYRVWIMEEEDLEAVPVAEWLYTDAWVSTVVFLVMVGWLMFILLHPKGAYQGIVFFLLIASTFLMDVNRFQAWAIHFVYLFCLPEESEEDQTLLSVIVMVSVTYVLSGLHKFNPGFEAETLPWLLTPFGLAPNRFLALILPLIEVLLGLGVCFPRINHWVSGCCILMHGLIVYVLIYYRWNTGVIPWNGMLICFHVLLIAHGKLVWRIPDWRNMPMLMMMVLVPFLGYAGVIHSSFSFPLYAGNLYSGIVVFSKPMYERLPEEMKALSGRLTNTNEPFLDLDRYSFHQRGVPLFQDKRCYLSAATILFSYAQADDDMVLLVRNGPQFVFDKDLWAFTLSELNRKKVWLVN